MTDAPDAGEPAEVSRQELCDAYMSCYRPPCAEAGPCRDARLLRKAAQYLLRDPGPGGAFTVFPFYEAVSRSPECRATHKKHLCAVVKATELLETLCVNLFLQPWKKEIKTVKTFTGSFVYHLLPVFSSSTIKSILASIGYLPHTDTPSEFRLSEDANPDRAMQVGFELLLARLECLNLLELLEKNQLGPQELMEVLQRKVGATKLEEPIEKTIAMEPKEEEKVKNDEADGNEESLGLDPRLALPPQHKPWHCHRNSVDQSIMEMQRNYPDLAFRGRPLVSEKLHKANSRSRSSKDIRSASEGGRVTELPKGDKIKGSRKNTGSKADKVLGSNSCDNRKNAGTCTLGSTDSGTEGGRDDEEFSGPQGISLHITLRTGSNAERSQNAGEPQPPADAPGWKQQQQQQQAVAETQKQEFSSMSSVDEYQDLRELAERMGQIHVQETKEEMSRRGAENKSKERRKRGRKTSAQGESEEHDLRKPVMETGAAVSQDASGCTRSSQSAHTAPKQQKSASARHLSPLNASTADGESSKGGGGAGQQEGGGARGAEAGQGDEEHSAQGFVIVEHHKK